MNGRKLLSIIVVGVLTGIVVWGVALLLDMFVYQALLCRSSPSGQCDSSTQYAVVTATIIGAMAGLLGLVRLQAYRPLLIILATLVSLGGLMAFTADAVWYIQLIAMAILYGIAFAAFAWIARVRRFWIALLATVVIVVGLRLLLNS